VLLPADGSMINLCEDRYHFLSRVRSRIGGNSHCTAAAVAGRRK